MGNTILLNGSIPEGHIPKYTEIGVRGLLDSISEKLHRAQNPFGLEKTPTINMEDSPYDVEPEGLSLLRNLEPILIKVFATLDSLTKDEILILFEFLKGGKLYNEFDRLIEELIQAYHDSCSVQYKNIDLSLNKIFPSINGKANNNDIHKAKTYTKDYLYERIRKQDAMKKIVAELCGGNERNSYIVETPVGLYDTQLDFLGIVTDDGFAPEYSGSLQINGRDLYYLTTYEAEQGTAYTTGLYDKHGSYVPKLNNIIVGIGVSSDGVIFVFDPQLGHPYGGRALKIKQYKAILGTLDKETGNVIPNALWKRFSLGKNGLGKLEM